MLCSFGRLDRVFARVTRTLLSLEEQGQWLSQGEFRMIKMLLLALRMCKSSVVQMCLEFCKLPMLLKTFIDLFTAGLGCSAT